MEILDRAVDSAPSVRRSALRPGGGGNLCAFDCGCSDLYLISLSSRCLGFGASNEPLCHRCSHTFALHVCSYICSILASKEEALSCGGWCSFSIWHTRIILCFSLFSALTLLVTTVSFHALFCAYSPPSKAGRLLWTPLLTVMVT